MKLIALLVTSLVVSLLPLTATPLATGQGDAAAAVAARAAGVGAQLPAVGPANGGQVFTLTGNATVSHVDGGAQAGGKVFHTKINLADAILCSQHDIAAGQCTAETIPLNDTDPGVYLFFDSLTSWRIANNPEGTDALTLIGLVDSKGGFQMAGTFSYVPGVDQNNTFVYLSGKVSFEKGTLVPKKISGQALAASADLQHYGKGSFHSTGLLEP